MSSLDEETGTRTDRRSVVRERTRTEIIDAAWALVGEKGLAGLSMRDLAERVGLKAASLYSYFGGKSDIYDAMFAQGYRDFAEAIRQWRGGTGAGLAGRDALRAMAHLYFDFSVADPARFQLLFQRTVPDFEPSEAGYAGAVAVYEQMVDAFADLGITDSAAIDIWTALTTGLASQQLANEPGGDRWQRVVDRAVDAFALAEAPHFTDNASEGTNP